MSSLEHLLEHGLSYIEKDLSYKEWRYKMSDDGNWYGNENITIDNLWEICQYVYYRWAPERSLRQEI